MTARALLLVIGTLGVLLGACSAHEEAVSPPTATVQIAAARVQSIDEVLAAFGAVEYAPGHAIAVPIQVDAEVREVLVVPGVTVRRGQPLLHLGPSATSGLEVGKAARDSVAAEAEAGRVRRLRDVALATAAEVAAADAAAANALALSNSLHARIGDGHGIVIAAPADGVIDSLLVHAGELVTAGTVVLTIGDPGRLQVRLGIETADLATVRAGQAVELRAVAAARTAAGRIEVVDRHVDRDTHLAAALVSLPRDAALNVGESIRGRIIIATHVHAVTVPRSALLYDKGEAYVFTLGRDRAKRIAVSPGIDTGEAVELTDGISAGTNVIIGGNYELADGMLIRVVTGTPSP